MNFPSSEPMRPPVYKSSVTKSLYINMRDGVRLAVDLSIPRDLEPGNKIPALFAATRYWRSQELKPPFCWMFSLPDSARDFFVAYGYALLRIDMRGTGASYGSQPHPWPKSDINDLYDLVEWVIQQPWSNGKVNAFGNSYQATTAEMLGASRHPAVESALVRFNEFDVYTDIGFPGGVPNEFILREWANFNRALDGNQLPKNMSLLEKIIVKGVLPVDGPVPSHENQQVDSVLRNITFRDDFDPELQTDMDSISIHTRPTTHMIDHWGSWFDAATADAVIKRFANNPHPQRAVIGSWNHGASQHVGLKKNPFPLLAQMKEALRFFDKPPSTRELHYYTINENKWKVTSIWPPVGLRTDRYYFQSVNGLSQSPSDSPASNHYKVDFFASTGFNNRWQTELDQRPVHYSAQSALPAYISEALIRDLEILGYPVVSLFIKSSHTDGTFFVYLESVDEKGNVQYLTEGMLRAIHRKISSEKPPYKQFVPYHSFLQKDALPLIPGEIAELTIGLNPISVLIKQGSRLRVSIAGSDKDTFLRIPNDETPEIDIFSGGIHSSFIDIPINSSGQI